MVHDADDVGATQAAYRLDLLVMIDQDDLLALPRHGCAWHLVEESRFGDVPRVEDGGTLAGDVAQAIREVEVAVPTGVQKLGQDDGGEDRVVVRMSVTKDVDRAQGDSS